MKRKEKNKRFIAGKNKNKQIIIKAVNTDEPIKFGGLVVSCDRERNHLDEK